MFQDVKVKSRSSSKEALSRWSANANLERRGAGFYVGVAVDIDKDGTPFLIPFVCPHRASELRMPKAELVDPRFAAPVASLPADRWDDGTIPVAALQIRSDSDLTKLEEECTALLKERANAIHSLLV
jgi:hypothetical protein